MRRIPRSCCSVRAEAFVDNLLPVMTGQPAFEMDLGFGLSRETPDVLCFPAGKFGGHLRPRIFKGVLAGIPHDAFAAVVTSFHLPPDMPPEAWRKLALEGPGDPPATGPEEGGIAFIWDLSSEGDAVTNMGVVIANQSAPDDGSSIQKLFYRSEAYGRVRRRHGLSGRHIRAASHPHERGLRAPVAQRARLGERIPCGSIQRPNSFFSF